MDVAALNLEINSSSVVTAADNLDRFADSSKRAGMSSGSISRIAQDYARSAEKINQFSNSAARAAEAAQRSARFATYGAAAIKEVGNTSRVAAHLSQQRTVPSSPADAAKCSSGDNVRAVTAPA